MRSRISALEAHRSQAGSARAWLGVTLLMSLLSSGVLPAQADDDAATNLDERARAILAQLDGDDGTADGEGKGGWKSSDLSDQLRDVFESMADAERATYYTLTLDEVKLALGEHQAPPTNQHTFEMQAEFVKSGDRVVAIHFWGRSSIKDRARVFLRLRYPDPDKSGAVLSWRTILDRDGTFDIRFGMQDQKLLYGNYYVTGILDPRNTSAAEDCIEGHFTDHRGRTYARYWRGFQRRILTFGTPQLVAVQEIKLKRFYVGMLEGNLMPLYLDFMDRWQAFATGEEGTDSVIVQGPEVNPGPTPEIEQEVFDVRLWRSFIDEEFRPFLAANRETLQDHRSAYLRPAFPEILDTLLLLLRDLDELTRRKSIELYGLLGLPSDPIDTPASFPEHLDPRVWQQRVDRGIQQLRKQGLRPQSLRALEEMATALGLEIDEEDLLDLPQREE